MIKAQNPLEELKRVEADQRVKSINIIKVRVDIIREVEKVHLHQMKVIKKSLR